MMRSRFLSARECHWDRDRRRRIEEMRRRERLIETATATRLEAMAEQLAEIRALPELETRR